MIVTHKQLLPNGVEVFGHPDLDLTGFLWFTSLTATLHKPWARNMKVLLLSYMCKFQPIRLSSVQVVFLRGPCWGWHCLTSLLTAWRAGSAPCWHCLLKSCPHQRAAAAMLQAQGITEVWGSDFVIPFLTPLLLWHLGEWAIAVRAWRWGHPPVVSCRDVGWSTAKVGADGIEAASPTQLEMYLHVSSKKRDNLRRYRLSELYEGAHSKMIISGPFLLLLNFIIQVFVLIHSLLFSLPWVIVFFP